jgi:hypothetical protein
MEANTLCGEREPRSGEEGGGPGLLCRRRRRQCPALISPFIDAFVCAAVCAAPLCPIQVQRAVLKSLCLEASFSIEAQLFAPL